TAVTMPRTAISAWTRVSTRWSGAAGGAAKARAGASASRSATESGRQRRRADIGGILSVRRNGSRGPGPGHRPRERPGVRLFRGHAPALTPVKALPVRLREDAPHGRLPALRRRAAPPLRPAGTALHLLPHRAAVQQRLR